MAQLHKIKTDPGAYWITVLLVIILLGLFGREALAWVLMKLYEFVVQRTLVVL